MLLGYTAQRAVSSIIPSSQVQQLIGEFVFLEDLFGPAVSCLSVVRECSSLVIFYSFVRDQQIFISLTFLDFLKIKFNLETSN